MRTDFRLGEWLVQPELNRVRGSEGEFHLEPRVMDVLVHLARHAGEVLPKERVIQAVWSGAFVSDETGRSEVYVTSFPARDQRIVVSSGGGRRRHLVPLRERALLQGPPAFHEGEPSLV